MQYPIDSNSCIEGGDSTITPSPSFTSYSPTTDSKSFSDSPWSFYYYTIKLQQSTSFTLTNMLTLPNEIKPWCTIFHDLVPDTFIDNITVAVFA